MKHVNKFEILGSWVMKWEMSHEKKEMSDHKWAILMRNEQYEIRYEKWVMINK